MRIVIALLFLILFSFKAFAQETADPFLLGIAAYQKGEFQKSQEAFSQLFEQHPLNPQVMFNLGLAQYKLGKKGLALGLWRKARFLNQDSRPIGNAIDFVEEELSLHSSESGIFATLSLWAKKMPISIWLLTTLLLTLLAGWRVITRFAKRKALFTELPLWIFLTVPLWILTLSVSLWLSLSEMEFTATVIEAEVSTRTGPSSTAPDLSSIPEGTIVTILKVHKEWVQVQTQLDGPGWILKNQIIAVKD